MAPRGLALGLLQLAALLQLSLVSADFQYFYLVRYHRTNEPHLRASLEQLARAAC